ncbi:MAG: type II secretion system F family protein [Bdellovibrionaceae bacterium]|nr:type II secretion system F family protein [Pseudobdellovibrionaceae bacterium]
MSALLSHPFVVIPAVSILVFVIVYLNVDRFLAFLSRRSLGQREEVIRLLELMFVDVDRKRVTQLMLAMSFGLGSLMFIALWPNLIPGIILGSAITVAGWSIPKNVVYSLWNKRCTKFVDQMVDGMTIMANGVKAGLSVQQSMERVVENMSNPMSQEFALVLSQMRLGRSLEEALNELGTRIPRPDVQMFVTSVNILQETGGNLAETFQTIVYTVRERQKIEKKIEALTAQGMMQGIIITLVPFFLLLVFFILDPAYVMPLFTTVLGVIALIIMLTLQVIGGVMIRKIVKINV